VRSHSILIVLALPCCEMVADDVRPRQLARTVYIVSMANELDQYLASRLTSGDVLRVVVEPVRADVVLTDKLDAAFWAWLAVSYPATGAPSNTDFTFRKRSPSNKGDQGTVFLVDPRARVVLWSTYNRGRSTSPDELDHTAEHIAKHLKSSLYEK
jgi:hypothetical protein